MVKEANVSMSRVALFSCAPGSARGTGLLMKMSRRITSVSDRTFSRLVRLGVLVLAIGVAAFGTIYYQDQHVAGGPSMIDRQTQSAEAAVQKAPNNLNVRLQLAAAYQSSNRLDDALTQYDIILKVAKANQAALLGSGSVLTAKGNLTAAAAAYRKVIAESATGEFAGADPQLQQAYYYLASIAVTQGKANEAITELAAALKINGQDSDSLYLMGVAQLKAGAPQLAVDAFNQALKFVPTGWCQPYAQLALAYGKLHRAPQAAYSAGMADTCKSPAVATSRLKTLIKGPEAVNAMLGIALIAETQGSNAEAITWYQKVLTVDRKNLAAIASLKQLGAGTTPAKTSPSPKAAGSSTTQGPS
jgi:tetratricopeptide (TPR) repeat protein